MDGGTLAPCVVERNWNPRATTPTKTLNDLPAADLEITGVAVLPDGSTEPMLFKGVSKYPKFKLELRAPLTPSGGALGSYAPLNAG